MKQYQSSLETERLAMAPLKAADANFIFELVNTKGWLQFIGDRNVRSVPDAEIYIEKIISNPDILYWVVRSKEHNVAVGIITLIKRSDLANPDLGFAFLPAFGNNGYAFEACSAAVQYISVHGDLNACFLNAITVPANTDSVRLLRKLGFDFIGERNVHNDLVHLYGAEADKILISISVHSFFSAFTNTGGRQPRLEALAEICLPEALIICKKGARTEIMGLSTFTPHREKILTDGTLKDFEEKETAEETRIIGGIAQRYSEYKKKGIMEGEPFETKGHKLFQLIKQDGSWKITSCVWTDMNG
jgi:RimJ/RimL family protein N-acetyltransferase